MYRYAGTGSNLLTFIWHAELLFEFAVPSCMYVSVGAVLLHPGWLLVNWLILFKAMWSWMRSWMVPGSPPIVLRPTRWASRQWGSWSQEAQEGAEDALHWPLPRRLPTACGRSVKRSISGCNFMFISDPNPHESSVVDPNLFWGSGSDFLDNFISGSDPSTDLTFKESLLKLIVRYLLIILSLQKYSKINNSQWERYPLYPCWSYQDTKLLILDLYYFFVSKSVLFLDFKTIDCAKNYMHEIQRDFL